MESPAPRFIGRVLVVEDNPINRLVACEMLESLGVQYETAEDGVAALEKQQMARFDLVLMDCLMPRLDGFAATAIWRERERSRGGPATPIVAVTANASNEDRERCLACGMDDFLGKPMRLNQLASLVARHLRAA